MASLADLLPGSSDVSQILLWNVFGQIISALTEPALTALNQETWDGAVSASGGGVSKVLDPAVLADLVIRNFLDQASASSQAAKAGVDGTNFGLLVDNAGDAPGPQELAVALRRKIIAQDGTGADSTSFEQGIAEGRLKDKWAPIIQALAEQWPTPNDALDAYLEGQVDETTAQQLYQQFGGDPDYFTLLYNTRGNAPTPTQGLEMLNRGIIPATGTGPDATSYQQLFLEGPWRNKWLPAMQALAAYLPPPRTVTALERAGVLTAEQAQKYYAMAGMDADLAAAYSENASVDKLAGTRLVAEATVKTLYEAGALSDAQATTMLNDLGYSNDEAAYVLSVYEFQREVRFVNTAISKIHTFYVGHKINRAAAQAALGELELPDDQVTFLLKEWDIEATASVKELTDTTIAQAVYYGAMTSDEAITELQRLGYSNYAAQVFLAVHLNSQQATPIPVPAPGEALNP